MDTPLAYTQSPQALADLRALNARFIHNYVTNDVPSHDDLLHKDFICLSSSGKRIDRASYLKRWANLFDPDVVIYWDTRDELISVFGNVALVRATNKHTERRDGIETTGMTNYTDTYLYENGAWKCIQAHMTSVAPEHWPDESSIVSVYIRGQMQPRT